MKPPLPLWSKVLLLASLNLLLLGLALALIVRAEFRMDPGSFLLAPAQSRIMATAQALALELDAAQPGTWDAIVEHYARTYGVAISLFDEDGSRVAGRDRPLPREVSDRIPRRQRQPPGPPRQDRPPERGRPPRPGQPQQTDRPPNPDRPPPKDDTGAEKRTGAPPLFLTATSNPAEYWAGVRIPVRRERDRDPHPGVLLLSSSSLLSSRLFFDVTPWVTIGAAVILVSIVCWLPFIRGLTRSISQMTRAAGQVSEGQFAIHVADRRRDELGQLGAAINRMAARLAGFVDGQKRFLSGIAHELCTPLATIQFGLGGLERRVGEADRDAVADIREEAEHMSGLVNELLSFSRAGMRALDIKLVPVNVAATVMRVLERETSQEVQVEVSVAEDLNVLATPEYLFRALANVVRNAIRYAGHAGPIQISARNGQEEISIIVADSGPGVPEHSLEEIFAPFYRVDASRDRETGGLGLGLAIVRDCVEACRGAVRCRNRRPSGLEVELQLPKAKL